MPPSIGFIVHARPTLDAPSSHTLVSVRDRGTCDLGSITPCRQRTKFVGSSCDSVVLEPGQHSLPAVLRLLRTIARTVIGVEAVGRIGIDDNLRGLGRGLERGAQCVDLRYRDTGIGAAVEPEDRRGGSVSKIGGIVARQSCFLPLVGSVPGDARLW